MTRRTALESPRLRKLWRGRSWILTAVLGGTTLYTAATMMHDGAQRRLATGLITQATALHISALVSRADLLREVWGYAAGTESRTVETHLAALRERLGDDPHSPRYIVTVRRAGYRLGTT